MNTPRKYKKLQKGGLWNSNRVGFVDSVNNANSNKDFIRRMYEQNTPSIQVAGFPGRSTHLMGWDGNLRISPQVVRQADGKLHYLQTEDARDEYAAKTGEYIDFKTPEQAEWYANNGYKQGTNVLNNIKTFKMGGKNVMSKGKPMYKRADGKIVRRGLWSNVYLKKKQAGGILETPEERMLRHKKEYDSYYRTIPPIQGNLSNDDLNYLGHKFRGTYSAGYVPGSYVEQPKDIKADGRLVSQQLSNEQIAQMNKYMAETGIGTNMWQSLPNVFSDHKGNTKLYQNGGQSYNNLNNLKSNNMYNSMPNFRSVMFNNPSYLNFMQDGGEMSPQDQQADAQQQQQAQGQPQDPNAAPQGQQGQGGNQAQQMAQQFLQAFAQMPPEAQQIVMQALMQQAQQSQGQGQPQQGQPQGQ